MILARSSSRLRIALLLAIVAGAITFFVASHLGTAAYVAAAVSLMLFLVEIVLGVADGARSSDGNS